MERVTISSVKNKTLIWQKWDKERRLKLRTVTQELDRQ